MKEKVIRHEDNSGYWSQTIYDKDGKRIYMENQDGVVFDNRPKPKNMNNKLKAHLKAIGTMLAIVGASIVLSLLSPTVILALTLLTPIAFIYWLVYENFLRNKKN